MGQTLRKLFDGFFGNAEMRVVMLGLDAAGKTTILYKLHIGKVLSTVPTIGFNVEKVQYKNVVFMVWDVGGQERLRPLWRHYFHNTDGLKGPMMPMEVCEGLGLLMFRTGSGTYRGHVHAGGTGLYEGLDWLVSTLKEMRASRLSVGTSYS